MRPVETEGQRKTTLVLCAVLHAFTHLYPTVLPPLYYQIARDLSPPWAPEGAVWPTTLLASAQSLAYCLTGLPLGFLADRTSRKLLLVLGLTLNALGFLGLGLAPSYAWALVLLIAAGVGGGFYHPPANALVTALYPERQGRAIGLASMGAAVGFFLGPLYGGWRAEGAGWRAPCLELGLAGLVAAVVFALLARDAPRSSPVGVHRDGSRFLGYFVLLSVAFGARDFAGVGFTTLTALFLQQAHGLGVSVTGLYLGLMSLAAVPANPLLGAASDGPRRLRWAGAILAAAALGALFVPWLPRGAVLLGLVWFGFFLFASYPVVEASMSEVLPDRMRGRAFGVFLASGGLLGSSAPWAMGFAKDYLAGSATDAAAFRSAYAALAGLLLLSVALGIPLLRWVRHRLRATIADADRTPATGMAATEGRP